MSNEAAGRGDKRRDATRGANCARRGAAFLINVDKVGRGGPRKRQRGIIQKPAARAHTNYKVTPVCLRFCLRIDGIAIGLPPTLAMERGIGGIVEPNRRFSCSKVTLTASMLITLIIRDTDRARTRRLYRVITHLGRLGEEIELRTARICTLLDVRCFLFPSSQPHRLRNVLFGA